MKNNASSKYTVIKTTKADKKAIMRFYKEQRYPASYIGQDNGYIVKSNNAIIASAIVSAGQECGQFWLLHALVTDRSFRRKNIASSILQTIISEKNSLAQTSFEKIICFADIELQAFYLSNQFISYSIISDITQLPLEFKRRFKRYQEKQRNLHCFLYNANS